MKWYHHQPIIQVRILCTREVKKLLQGHPGRKWMGKCYGGPGCKGMEKLPYEGSTVGRVLAGRMEHVLHAHDHGHLEEASLAPRPLPVPGRSREAPDTFFQRLLPDLPRLNVCLPLLKHSLSMGPLPMPPVVLKYTSAPWWTFIPLE